MIDSIRGKCRKGFIFLFASVVILGIWGYTPFTVNGEYHKKQVLFISSYTESFLTVPEQIKGIQMAFENEDVQLDIEYMDTKRFDTEEKRLHFYESLKYNLEHLPKYDVVIVGDDNALDFVVKHQKELFDKIPIIFLGINHIEKAEEVAKDPYITGIIEETSIKENIEIAKKFNKEATKVVAIVDGTLTGIGDENQFLSAKEYFTELDFEVINFSAYSYEEFGYVIEDIDEDTILIFLSMNQDKNGTTVSIESAVELFNEYAKVPVYRPLIGGVGEGLMGGNMISYIKSGEIAATMAMNILNGTPVESIEVITKSPNQYFFDYELLQKYGIDEKLIPEEAILVNSPPNIFEEYGEYIIYVSAILILLIIIVVILFFDNIRRRRMSIVLRESNDELSITTEELIASQDELQEQYDTIHAQVENFRILNEKYEIAIQSTETVVWEVNIKEKTINISGNIGDIYIGTNGEDRNFYEVMNNILAPGEVQKIDAEYDKYINGEIKEINLQLSIADSEHGHKWILLRGKGVFNSAGKVNILHGIIMDITKTRTQEEYIDFLAHHDYLTKLPNRMSFMQRLQEVILVGGSGAVFMVDIDNFKGVNDTLGHMYGDILLIEIANRLNTILDENLFISRFGGDEFLLLLTGTSMREEVEVYVNKVREVFVQTYQIEGRTNYISFSMGITCFPEDSTDIDQLIMNADTAMYKVKHGGKNNFMFYHDDMQEELKKKTDIEHIMRAALKKEGFELVYQPKIDIKTGIVSGFEALLRLREYKISPGDFIPVAEESGLINKIGRWVTRNVIKQIAIWRDKGLEGKRVSINFSTQQIKDEGYIAFLMESLEEYNVDPSSLEIEITESIFLEETEATLLYLDRLKEIGLGISLDDFGTGYSSLNYLTYMPVDMIKLDKSLNDKFLEVDSKDLIDALISLAHCLKLKITAEGIEKPEQYQKLKESGCDYIQGYLFSKPLKVEEIESIYYENMVEKVLGQ